MQLRKGQRGLEKGGEDVPRHGAVSHKTRLSKLGPCSWEVLAPQGYTRPLQNQEWRGGGRLPWCYSFVGVCSWPQLSQTWAGRAAGLSQRSYPKQGQRNNFI